MYFAIGVEPTKDTALMSGCMRIASTASLSPWMTLNTPSGKPASSSNSAIRMLMLGSRSEGLRMKVLPQASATGNIHIGTMAGKLKGVIPAHTPTGWRSEKLSTSVPTLSLKSPLSRCGMPVANSITSMPRVIEPSASAAVFPCSCETSRARSDLCVCIRSRKRIRMRARRSAGAARHDGNAVLAASTAASTSKASARGTWRTTSPVAGLVTSPYRVVCAATARPPIHSGSRSNVVRSMAPPSHAASCSSVCVRSFDSIGSTQPLHVARDQVDLEIDAPTGAKRTEARHHQCMRDQVHRKVSPVDGIHRQTHAVDCDRAFGRDKACELARHCHFEQHASPLRHRLRSLHHADAVDVAAHQVSAQPIGKSQRLFHVDRADAVEPGRAVQRLGRYVKAHRAGVDRNDGEAAAVERDTVAHCDVILRESSRVDGDLHPLRTRLHRDDAADCLHDAGKHQALFGSTRATMRQSPPTASILRTLGETRSSKPCSGAGSANMPRAGSPSRHGAT